MGGATAGTSGIGVSSRVKSIFENASWRSMCAISVVPENFLPYRLLILDVGDRHYASGCEVFSVAEGVFGARRRACWPTYCGIFYSCQLSISIGSSPVFSSRLVR